MAVGACTTSRIPQFWAGAPSRLGSFSREGALPPVSLGERPHSPPSLVSGRGRAWAHGDPPTARLDPRGSTCMGWGVAAGGGAAGRGGTGGRLGEWGCDRAPGGSVALTRGSDTLLRRWAERRSSVEKQEVHVGEKVTSESWAFKGTEVGGPEVRQEGAVLQAPRLVRVGVCGVVRSSAPFSHLWGVCQEQGTG